MELYPHQIKALEETEQFKNTAYYLDMGLGKTFVGAEKAMRLNKNILVVCQKSKVDDWKQHFMEHYPLAYIYNLTDKKSLGEFFEDVISENYRPIVGIINYDLIFRKKQFLHLENFTLLLDESSLIQNDSAKRTKFILKLKPDNVILLSGTPTSGKYENLWTQIHLLGWDISKQLYNKQYVNWKKVDLGGFIHKVVDKDEPYKNVERLKAKLRQNGAVFLKTEECFNLPEQIEIPIKVKKSKEYNKFMKNSIVTVRGTQWVEDSSESDFWGTAYVKEEVQLVGDTTLTKRLYSRMLCGQYNKEKLEAFKDLVMSTQDRLIVFYNFNEELESMKKICIELKRPISEVNGQVKNLYSYENKNDSVTFIQYQAGAMGLNLQKANKIIYFTLTEKSELFEQSKKRIHRIGQNQPCFYYLMICENSIEEDILKTLKMRKDYTDELFVNYDGSDNK